MAAVRGNGLVRRDYSSLGKGFQVLFLEKPAESMMENQHFVTCHEEC